jgi:hypothetical protein
VSRLSGNPGPGPKLVMGLVTLYLVAIFCVLVIPLCSSEPDRPASAHYQGPALCVSGPFYFGYWALIQPNIQGLLHSPAPVRPA